jgi:membrane protein YqaA with SNARE-associated domain
MCPLCIANLALLATGMSTTGGLAGFALRKVLKKKQTTRKKQNENCTNEIETRNRVAS